MRQLVPLISEKHSTETITAAEYREVEDAMVRAWEEFPKGLKVQVAYAIVEATGEGFYDVDFRVESRYRRGRSQERYFAGGGFEVSMDSMLRKMKERVK